MNPGLRLNPDPVMLVPRPLHRLIVLAALALGGCGSDHDGVARVAVIGATPRLVETVEAPLSAGDALVRANMAQGLVRFDANGQVVPGVAERWNVSNDGLSYIFRLQTGEWPDGRKIKADEVARILSRQLRAASKNPLRDTLGAVDQVVAMTDRVIEIRLLAPRPYLLQLLAQPEYGLVRASGGTGPFRLPPPDDPLSADDTNAKALGASVYLVHRISLPDAKDPIERVRLYGGEAAPLIAAFMDKKIELLLGGTVSDLPLALSAKVPRGALRFDPVAGLFGLIPTARSDLLQERDVRSLLSRAIDRQAMIAALRVDGLVPRATLLQPGLEAVGQPAQPDWLGVPMADRRPQLVAEAKRIFGDTERPTLRLAMPAGRGGDLMFRRISADWGALGIKTERAPTPASADLVWIDEVAPSASPAWLLRRFRCEIAPICVEAAEPLLAAARAAPVAAQRAALFLEAARMMDEAELFIAIAAPIRWSLVSGRAPGFAENPFARHTLVGLSDTKISGDTP